MNLKNAFASPTAARTWRGVAAIGLLVMAAIAWHVPVAADASTASATLAPSTVIGASPDAPKKVLRYSLRVAETGFDPAQISDLYSSYMAANMFDSLYSYEFMRRPNTLRFNTATALPEYSADFKTITIRIRPGIFFADDPAFKGRKRELVAADYVYAIKRHFDPRWKSPRLSDLETNHFVGIDALRAAALNGQPFDYDKAVEGMRAIDRYTVRFIQGQPNPRFVNESLADGAITGAVAREVVEFYGDKIMEHPVGTGPFQLGTWRRSSLIAFDRNPNYRDEYYDEHPPADDPVMVAAATRLKGRKLPLVDRVEVSIIEQAQPRWLAFMNAETDFLEQVPEEFTAVGIPNNKVAPNLAKRGIYAVRYLRNDVSVSYFDMESPVVGGYTPQKVALRRAIGLAVDTAGEIRSVRRGQAIVAQSPIAPGTYGYDPAFKSEMGDFDRPRAQALLDLAGYVDRDGDGWRDQPDGSPLTLEYATQPDELNRQLITQWKKNMDAIHVRIVFRTAQWPENLKAARTGRLMMWGLGWSAGPDGEGFLQLGYGPEKGQANYARFDMPEFNRLYDLQHTMPDGPERIALMTKAKELMIAYMPYKIHVHRIWTDLAQPWVIGFDRNVFLRDYWRYVDIDPVMQARAQR